MPDSVSGLLWSGRLSRAATVGMGFDTSVRNPIVKFLCFIFAVRWASCPAWRIGDGLQFQRYLSRNDAVAGASSCDASTHETISAPFGRPDVSGVEASLLVRLRRLPVSSI